MKLPIYAIVCKQDNRHYLRDMSGRPFSGSSKTLMEMVLLDENPFVNPEQNNWEVKLIEEVELREGNVST